MTEAPPAPAPTAPGQSRDRALKLTALVAGLCLVGFIAYVVLSGDHRPARPVVASGPSSLHTGTAAPDFTLPRLGGGDPVTLAATRGTPVVLNFFASWCPDCRAELATLAAEALQVTGRVDVVGVDTNDQAPATAERLLAAAGADYPVGVDLHAAVATRYLLSALPATYFIDGRGRVAGVYFGTLSTATLERWVGRLSDR